MIINLIYDSSVSAAPAGFKTAMAYAAQYLDSLITNPITVNIQVGWGEIGGNPIQSGVDAVGNQSTFPVVSYSQLVRYLTANASSSADAIALAHLPTTDPTNGNGFWISSAEQKAWGLIPANGTAIDGTVGFNDIYPLNFNTNNQAVPGELNFVSIAEHELTHALGRVSGLNASWSNLTPMDLFQYSAPGVIQTVKGQPAYFSIDGGVTNLNNFDTAYDAGDWTSSVKHDSFGYEAYGAVNPVTSTDIALMDVLGFNVAPQGGPSVSSLTAATDSNASTVGLGHAVTITLTASEIVNVKGSPTLQLNDGEVAQYVSGSGSNTLIFNYTVHSGDNTPDLQIIGLNTQVGSTIQDLPGYNIINPVTADLGVAIHAVSNPAATTVQQEVLGLYAVLYSRAADGPLLADWEGVVGSTAATAGATAVTTQQAQLLGQLFTQSSYFDTLYGGMTDNQFMSALYAHASGAAGDPAGIAAWTGLLATLEAQGVDARTARSEILGQFVEDFTMGSTALTNKMAVSLMYSTLSNQPGGAILDPHSVTDAAFQAATRAIQNVTSDPLTAETAIAHIQQSVADNNLALI